MNLELLGWNDAFAREMEKYREEGYRPGRIALEHKHLYRVYTEEGEMLAEVSGKLRHQAEGRGDFPAVGDWVALSPRPEEGKATIHGVLPRQSKFSRKVAGSVVEEQIVAANITTVFLVNALNKDYNLRRLERYLLLAWESGAEPVIVLSKSDLCGDVEGQVALTEAVACGVTIIPVSSETGEGLDLLLRYVGAGATVALLGSSGAGKSTLINKLYGVDILQTGSIREDDSRGRHTTTHRELVILPEGGMLIDTPGMRELQLWDAEDGFGESFADIEALASSCRFPDCRHHTEPGCAIKEALRSGSMDQSRYDNYVKLQREMAYLVRKEDKALQSAQKNKWKKINKQMRDISRDE